MPPVPTSSSSSYRSAMSSPTTAVNCARSSRGLSQGRLERLLPDAESLVELRIADDERHEDPDAVRVDAGLQEQQAALRSRLDDPARELGCRLLRLTVGDELDGQHRAESTYVADRVPTFLPREHALADLLADRGAAVVQALLFEDVENSHRRRLRDGVAHVGAAHRRVAGRVHDLRGAEHARERQ